MPETCEKNCGRPVFLEELQATRNFSKASLHFNKIPNSLKQVLQTYSQICIFLCATKKSSRSSRRRLISKGNLVMKLMTMWWNSYYSKFGSEIWRWFGILGISFFIQFFNFLQMLWLYSSVRNLSYSMVITLLSLLCNLSYGMQSLLSFLNGSGANKFFE